MSLTYLARSFSHCSHTTHDRLKENFHKWEFITIIIIIIIIIIIVVVVKDYMHFSVQEIM